MTRLHELPRMPARKIFCIGKNKTGTTSLERVLGDLGFRLGVQAEGERLLRDWAQRDFRRIVALAATADAFQDVPFSLPHTFRALDAAFPEARFILSVRASADEWYESLVRFHTKIVGAGRRPTSADLKAFGYCYPGFLWDIQRWVFGIHEGQEYDRAIYTAHYEHHNASVRQYFRDRPESLLELDVSHPDAMGRLGAFLGVATAGFQMPHLNASR